MTRRPATSAGGDPRTTARAWFGILAALLVSLPVSAADRAAPSQASSPNDPFAVYEATLSDAASKTLVRVVQPQPAATAGQALQEPGTGEALTTSPLHGLRGAQQRVDRLRPLLDPVLTQVGIPVELSAVVVVESGGDPAALSSKGARGLWQLMPDTARRYGLTVNAETDERLDVLKSTRAAAEYLRDLYTEFHDWQLALAAYNAGELTVQQAMARTGGAVFTTAARALPAETQNYVPAVLDALTRFGERMPQQFRSHARLQHTVYATEDR